MQYILWGEFGHGLEDWRERTQVEIVCLCFTPYNQVPARRLCFLGTYNVPETKVLLTVLLVLSLVCVAVL